MRNTPTDWKQRLFSVSNFTKNKLKKAPWTERARGCCERAERAAPPPRAPRARIPFADIRIAQNLRTCESNMPMKVY